MAQKSLPPGFSGIDFSQFASWPIVYRDGLPYREIPGNKSYLYDEFDGSQGSIKVDPHGIEAAIEAEEPEDGGILGQVAPAAGLLGGLYGAKKVLGGAEAAKEATGILGNSVEVAGAADTTGVAAQAAAAPEIIGGAEVASAPGLLSGFGPMASSAGGLGALGAIAGGTILGGKAAYDMARGEKPGLPGRIILGMATGGLSELAGGILGRKSTKEIQQDRRDALIDKGVTGYANYAQGNQFAVRPEIDQGFDASRDESKLTPEQVWGSEAMFETFGNDWLGKFDESQRKEISSRLISSGNISERKGGIYINDAKSAKQIADDVIGGGAPKPKSGLGSNVAQAIQPSSPSAPISIIGPTNQPRPVGFDLRGGRFVRR